MLAFLKYAEEATKGTESRSATHGKMTHYIDRMRMQRSLLRVVGTKKNILTKEGKTQGTQLILGKGDVNTLTKEGKTQGTRLKLGKGDVYTLTKEGKTQGSEFILGKVMSTL